MLESALRPYIVEAPTPISLRYRNKVEYLVEGTPGNFIQIAYVLQHLYNALDELSQPVVDQALAFDALQRHRLAEHDLVKSNWLGKHPMEVLNDYAQQSRDAKPTKTEWGHIITWLRVRASEKQGKPTVGKRPLILPLCRQAADLLKRGELPRVQRAIVEDPQTIRQQYYRRKNKVKQP